MEKIKAILEVDQEHLKNQRANVETRNGKGRG